MPSVSQISVQLTYYGLDVTYHSPALTNNPHNLRSFDTPLFHLNFCPPTAHLPPSGLQTRNSLGSHMTQLSQLAIRLSKVSILSPSFPTHSPQYVASSPELITSKLSTDSSSQNLAASSCSDKGSMIHYHTKRGWVEQQL